MISATELNLDEILGEARKSEEPLVLYGVSWQIYARLLDKIGENRYPRLSFCNGVLKIMGKQSFIYENKARFLYDLIRITSLILRIKVISSG